MVRKKQWNKCRQEQIEAEEKARKEKVVVDLYSNIHVLFDPIEDFVLEIQDIYFVDGKTHTFDKRLVAK